MNFIARTSSLNIGTQDWLSILFASYEIKCMYIYANCLLKTKSLGCCRILNQWCALHYKMILQKHGFGRNMSTRNQNISPNPNLALPPILIDRIWSGRVPVINDLLEQSTIVEKREFWLLKTSLIFQVISWDWMSIC